MTMVSSGEISIGGSATSGGLNRSINVELGLSATATSSLNDAAFRTLAGVPSGAISLSNFYGKANAANFFSTATSGEAAWGVSAALDPSGNIIVGGNDYLPGTSDPDALIAKYSPGGSASWYLLYDGSASSGSDVPRAVAADSAGNVYAGLALGTSPFGFFAKFNSSGTLQWCRAVYMNGPVYARNAVIHVDSSDNVYFGGSVPSGPEGDGLVVVKVDGSANVLWQRFIRTNNLTPGAITSNGTYVAVSCAIGFGSSAEIYVLNQSTGAVVNGRSVSPTSGTSVRIESLSMDGSNIYATVRESDNYARAFSTSITTVSTVNWVNILADFRYTGRSIAVAAPYYYWAVVTSLNYNKTIAYIVRGNLSDGSVNWVRSIQTHNLVDAAIVVNANAYTFVGVEGSGSSRMLTSRLPLDGSKTGTYTVGGASVVYSTPSPTFYNTVNVTTGSISPTNSTNVLTTSASPSQRSRTVTFSTTTI